MTFSTTFRNAIFQLHWFFGITAGVVLALVGFTGAMLSFEDAILKQLNPGVMTVTPRGEPLAPDALVARIRAQQPDNPVQSLTLSADPRESARVGFAPTPGATKGTRGESRFADPYSGAVLEQPRGEGFFRLTMQLHRWLVAKDVGKQIVGASTVILVFFCLSGLYLRWPRRWGSVRTWLALDWRQKGRNFLWHLHSVVGTWVLATYLVMSLTGLWWSYEWYRNGLKDWAGEPRQTQVRESGVPAVAPPELDIAAAWRTFERTAPDWSSVTLSWPRDGEPVAFRYLDRDPAHERARNEVRLDPGSLAVIEHQRYDSKPLRQRITGGIFALHRGSYFGTAGVVVFMLASALMPLFAITGWMLYLDRRRKQHAARDLVRSQPASLVDPMRASILIAFASQTGTAERLAWQTAAALREAGCGVDVQPLGRLPLQQLVDAGRVLFVVSTFGEGEAPDSARGFARRLRAGDPSLSGLRYGVLALGDREYEDSYCGFGRELDHRLQHAGAQPLFDRIEVDAGDAGALRHWQHHIGQLTGRTDLPDWSVPAYSRWRLVERVQLNHGSPGGAAFHLALTPGDPGELTWEAGDIAEIGPRNAAASVAAWLAHTGFDGNTEVGHDGARETLASLLARVHLPAVDGVRGQAPQALADALKPLPHREYSIASLPIDGSLQLLVRQMRRPDGHLGNGSGWLTAHAALGAPIDLRIRSNPSFHIPADERPLVLIGNGTGLAGLRAVLKARIAAGYRRNWLLFGERTAAHDFHYRDEVETWLRDGQLDRLDLAFSRDHAGSGHAASEHAGAENHRRYVQHLLHEQATQLRTWLDDGAAVYVCGSLEGMAPAVDAVLRGIVGADALETMAADGRYRRDVY